jgi:hypothetical protein
MPARISASAFFLILLAIIVMPVAAHAQPKHDWPKFDQQSADGRLVFASEAPAAQDRPLSRTDSLLRSLFEWASALMERERKVECLHDDERRDLNAQLDAIRKDFEDAIGEETRAAAAEVNDRTAAETTRLSEEIKRRLQGGDSAGALDARRKSIEAHKNAMAELKAMFSEEGLGRISFLTRSFGKAADEAEAKIARFRDCSGSAGTGIRG